MTTNKSVSSLFTECLQRDNHTCQDCGSIINLEVHHILPNSQGGKNELHNLKTVCGPCHNINYKDTHYPKDKSVIVPHSQRVKTKHGIDKSKNIQIMLNLPYDDFELVENYWHDKKLQNRNEAIRELVKIGLSK